VKKLTYIISDTDKALAFEWLALELKSKYKLTFILIGKRESKMAAFLNNHQIAYYELDDSIYGSLWKKWAALFNLLRRERPDIVHTHLWRANLLGLTANWLLRVKQRVFTRHHATIHYDQYPSGRKWDRLCNFLATDIIAISENIKTILIEKDRANPDKIHLIHHGFDFDYFKAATAERIATLRKKYNLPEETGPVIGVISRFVEWKGVQFIIPAFKKILEKYPKAKLILANAKGDYEQQLQLMLNQLPADSYQKIKFEEDLVTLYRLFDVFVHVPVDAYSEAFGQTYIEALLMQVPSVFTLSGIACEVIKHKRNALVVDYNNSEQIAEAVDLLLSDKKISAEIVRQGKEDVQPFSIPNHISLLEKLYAES
jgi:glycosyltransferase involved in cell wall biosynthesis